ncbi:hypothetical protein M8756_06950 [Lutimaribacter sp. EGI FJ00015]|uniref:Uncharacterized protein n=1 Tax=Lutimaribacter degradans TaxID=2945989 RepID=A0ACC5ZUD3_9RHOB|nr:hypothetical protein [Lutimaribacter sp. EGI FJ00013]MCM2561926.1 hypothetical protein [Lutimaribacter sp. EGI FJ00013]MCO0613042.1 hypothetical protein [Lutimaribacter sp. EGI FJ00015]MCO0635758.1 hypothetical protein [Lutimaribacter sp. EGI FJ00014]
MFDPKRYIMAGGTVIVALGIGVVMQRSPQPVPDTSAQTASLDTRSDAAVDTPVPMSGKAPEQPKLEVSDVSFISAPDKPMAVETEMSQAPAPIEIAALDAKAPATESPPAVPLSEVEACEPVMTATPAPAGMVDLAVSASCMPDARMTLHHNGMMISVLTDDEGNVQLRAPALASDALYIASFENGAGAVARANLDDLDAYQRVVLQWRGDAGFQVHALEYGADYGDAGHVWRDAPGDIGQILEGQGGYLTTLGDPDLPDGLRAEVYTFPVGAARDGDVILSAEAVVSEGNCNRDIEGQAIELGVGGTLKVQDLMLTVPSCDVSGDILLLKNLFQDLKIARN